MKVTNSYDRMYKYQAMSIRDNLYLQEKTK